MKTGPSQFVFPGTGMSITGSLTKKELFSLMAMMSFLKNSKICSIDWDAEIFAKISVRQAEALIEALNERKNDG
jgi:hypothetical protein